MTILNGSAMPEGQLFVISAPSGAGKTSLVAATLARVPHLTVSVSHTTRLPRPGEQDGRDYHFVDTEAFQALISAEALFEHAEVFGNFYGTSRDSVMQQLQSGTDVILEIDWQGAAQVRAIWPDAISVFILPPTREALRERLIGRRQDDPSIIDQRMAEADETMAQAPHFDHWVINDDFEVALDQLRALIIGYRTRREVVRAQSLNFLEKLLGQA
jgi:guanylate kinase